MNANGLVGAICVAALLAVFVACNASTVKDGWGQGAMRVYLMGVAMAIFSTACICAMALIAVVAA